MSQSPTSMCDGLFWEIIERSVMKNESSETLKTFMAEAEIIANYLRQQIRQGSISQALYVENIRRFLSAHENLKNTLK